MNARFGGKVAVVTGGGSGIGFATAAILVAEGAQVVIAGRTPERLEQAAQALGPERCAVVPADVSRPRSNVPPTEFASTAFCRGRRTRS